MVYFLLYYGQCIHIYYQLSFLTFIQVGIALLELLLAVPAFWSSDGASHQRANPQSSDTGNSRTREALTNKISWTCAIFLLGYVGVEVSLGGWLVTFMLRVRHGTAFASGMTVTGFCKHIYRIAFIVLIFSR